MNYFITAFFLVFSLQAFSGPSISSGPIGRELLHCTGQLNLVDESTEIILSLIPMPSIGLVAQIIFPNEPQRGSNYTVQRYEDPRGISYIDPSGQGAINILIPNIQNPPNEFSQFQAILNISIFPQAIIMNCSNQY